MTNLGLIMKSKVLNLSLTFLLTLVFSSNLAAQEEQAKQQVDDKQLSPGVIASYGRFANAAAIDAAMSPEAAGGEPNPVMASISRDGDQCVVKVTNSSDARSMRLSYQVVGQRGGKQAFSKYYSSSLRPGQSVERRVNGCGKDLSGAQVVLKSGKLQ